MGSSNAPERTWASLFYQYDRQKEIKIEFETLTGAREGGKFVCKDTTYSASVAREQVDEDFVRIDTNIQDDPITRSSLVCESISQTVDGKGLSTSITAVKGQARLSILKKRLPLTYFTVFLPTGFKPLPHQMAEGFEQLKFQGRDSLVLAAIKIIDNSFERIDVFTTDGSPRIHLKREGESYMPVSMFGDAVNKLIDIVLRIVQHPNGIFLIDEIENGIHYTHHEAFWKWLINQAITIGVQVFATSHSLEMIRAFNKVAIDYQLTNESQYIEMFRSARSGEIVGNFLAHDALAYAIAHHQPFRGE